MKNFTMLLLLLTTLSTTAQQQFFVGNDAELLKGKDVTVREGHKYYSGFYKDEELSKVLFKKGTGNDPEKLKGLVFTVIGSTKHPKSYINDLVLIMQNKDLGTVYYSYNPKYSDMFLLDVVGGFAPPENFLCSRLSPEKDKFSSKVTTSTPSNFEYSIYKIEENGSARIYLQLQSYGTTLNTGKTGIKILFSDGSVMEKPESKINFKSASGTKGWTYSCLFSLSKEDIETLTTKTITDYSLYIYERTLKETTAFELREYLKCLTK